MRIEGKSSSPDLDLPELISVNHYVRHGSLVLIDRQLSLGYAVRIDKRTSKGKVRDTKVVLVTPREMKVTEHGETGSRVYDPFAVSETHKATGFFLNSARKVVTAATYVLDMQRVSTSYGAKNLELIVTSLAPQLEAIMHHDEELDVSTLEGHLTALNSPE